MTKISIIIPAYNAERFLAFTLDSVAAQTFSAWEAIIVDDGSRDNTHAIAQEYVQRDNRFRIVCQENRGLPAARNAGYAASDAASEFLIFLDSDDTWEADALQTLFATLKSHPQAPAAHGVVRLIDADGHLFLPGDGEAATRRRYGIVGRKWVEHPRHKPTTFAMLAYRNCLPTPGMVLIRRAALEEVGPFVETLRSAEDWEMWLRLTRRHNLAFVDKIVLNYRKHGANMSAKDKVMRQAELEVRRIAMTLPGLTPQQKRAALLGYRIYERHYAALQLEIVLDALRQRLLRNAVGHLRNAVFAGVRSLPGGPR